MAVIGNRFTPAFAGSRPNEPTPAPPGPDVQLQPLASLINGRRVRGQLLINGSTDYDPTVASVELEWGDGTPRAAVAPPYNIVHEYAAEGTYELRAIATSTSRRTTVATGRVQALGDPTALPTANFIYAPLPPDLHPGDEVTFDATASQPGTGGPIVRYDWDWGDGTAQGLDVGPTPTHTYATVGTFTCQMQVTDQVGERAVTNRFVIPMEPPTEEPEP